MQVRRTPGRSSNTVNNFFKFTLCDFLGGFWWVFFDAPKWLCFIKFRWDGMSQEVFCFCKTSGIMFWFCKCKTTPYFGIELSIQRKQWKSGNYCSRIIKFICLARGWGFVWIQKLNNHLFSMFLKGVGESF